MTDELKQRLINAGLSKQQATSVTAETLVQLFMQDDKLLVQEAKAQVDEMRKTVALLQKDYYDLKKKMSDISDTLLAISTAQEEYGTIDDEKARTVVALYGALLSMNENVRADGSESVKNASYIMYAFLGGQAKRDVSYSDDKRKIY